MPVKGDVKELDAIVSNSGIISLDRDDIVSVLEAEGESFIIKGQADDLAEAIKLTLREIPLDKKVTDMAVAIWCGAPQFPMSEMSSVSNALSEFEAEANILWGVFADPVLGDSFKVVIVANGKEMA